MAGPAPFIPLFLLFIVVLGIIVPWYLSYEPAVEDFTQQMQFLLMLVPLLLLFAVKAVSSSSSSWNVLPPSDPSAIHRVGGSPVGIGIILVIVLTMIWYQSSFLDSWHPFFT